MEKNLYETLLGIAQNFEFTDIDKVNVGALKRKSKSELYYNRFIFTSLAHIPDRVKKNPEKYFKHCFYCFKDDLNIIYNERGGFGQ